MATSTLTRQGGQKSVEAKPIEDPLAEIFEKTKPKELPNPKKPYSPIVLKELDDLYNRGLISEKEAETLYLAIVQRARGESRLGDEEALDARAQEEVGRRATAVHAVAKKMSENPAGSSFKAQHDEIMAGRGSLYSEEELERIGDSTLVLARSEAGLEEGEAWSNASGKKLAGQVKSVHVLSKVEQAEKGLAGEEGFARAVVSVVSSKEKMALVESLVRISQATGESPEAVYEKLAEINQLMILDRIISFASEEQSRKKKGRNAENTQQEDFFLGAPLARGKLNLDESALILSRDDLLRAFDLTPDSVEAGRLDQLLASLYNTPEFKSLAGQPPHFSSVTAVAASLAYRKAMEYGIDVEGKEKQTTY